MKTGILSLLTILLSAQCVMAQAEPVIIDRPEQGVLRDSSEHNRMGKKFSVQYLVGVTSSVAAHGAVGAYFLDRNTLIQLELLGPGSTSRSDSSGSLSQSETRRDLRSYGVHMKKFSGNSFYVNGGLDWRLFDYKYSYTSSSGAPYDVKSSFNAQSLNAALAIGNQWQWENFTLGCDWIGVSIPVALQEIKDENIQAQFFYDSEKSSIESEKKYLVKNTQYHLLRLYAGWSF